MTTGGAHQDRNISILYLALLCLIYFLFVSGSRYLSLRREAPGDTRGKIYVEIDGGYSSVVKAFDNHHELIELANTYNIDKQLKNGDKVVLEDGGKLEFGRISGLKSLSLGIPIGINSAGAEDLEALPGIGAKLAERIVSYRNEKGRFTGVEELLEVMGMGEKKLSLVRPFINLD